EMEGQGTWTLLIFERRLENKAGPGRLARWSVSKRDKRRVYVESALISSSAKSRVSPKFGNDSLVTKNTARMPRGTIVNPSFRVRIDSTRVHLREIKSVTSSLLFRYTSWRKG